MEQTIVLEIYEPGQLTSLNLGICLLLLKEGEAVTGMRTAKQDLPRSTVALLRDHQDIVGLGAVKCERPDYVAKIIDRSAFVFPLTTLELGYITVRTSHRNRGLSKHIIETLLTRFSKESLFATTSSVPMISVLRANRFSVKGNRWERGSKTLSLWVRTRARKAAHSL